LEKKVRLLNEVAVVLSSTDHLMKTTKAVRLGEFGNDKE
jgi:hypothetical protein